VPRQGHLECKRTVKGDLEEIKALHRPLLPPDIIHTIAVVALKAQGNMMFRNIFYEYSFFFIQELAKMKAIVVMADPTKIITFGPTAFKPAKMICSDIIQATYALVLAGLSAPGRSELLECDSLFRRFPNIAEQFNSL
jgi:UDP-N-acetylglucosamine 1-carboxyvinyltransferase